MPLPKAPTKKGSLLTQTMASSPSEMGAKIPTDISTPSSTLSSAPKPPKIAPHTARKSQPIAHITPATPHVTPAAPKVPTATANLAKAPVTHKKVEHRRARKKDADTSTKKLFVLDTNVMLHDPSCFFRFEEHDVYIPLIALEELDAHKKGTTETARNGRSVSRMLDQLMAASPDDLEQGIPLNTLNKISFTEQLG